MMTRDYNETGRWSVAGVQERYLDYCARLGVAEPRRIASRVYSNAGSTWVYPVMEAVIEGVKAGDLACAAIAVDFIEEDGRFRFGRTLKSNAARALKRVELPHSLKVRIGRRVAAMLAAGNTPREFKEYARLLRHVGFDDIWPRMASSPPSDNKYAMRHFAYFRAIHERSPAVTRADDGDLQEETR